MITEQVTKYTFFIDDPLIVDTPDGNILLDRAIDVELTNRKDNLWAIRLMGQSVLSRDGSTEMESMPSWRTEDFLKRTRFSLEEALQLARDFIAKGKPFVPAKK